MLDPLQRRILVDTGEDQHNQNSQGHVDHRLPASFSRVWSSLREIHRRLDGSDDRKLQRVNRAEFRVGMLEI